MTASRGSKRKDQTGHERMQRENEGARRAGEVAAVCRNDGTKMGRKKSKGNRSGPGVFER